MLLPEKVVVKFPIANLGSRAMAQIIDLVLCTGLILLTLMGLGQLQRILPAEIVGVFLFLLIPAIPLLYFIVLEAFWGGQTIGKKAYRLRVCMADGTPITPVAAIYRNLARLADFLPTLYLIGFVSIFMNERCQRIGDLLAGTMVLNEQHILPRFTASPHRFGVHPFEDAVGNLRGMTREEYVVIKRLCDRYPELPAATRDRLMEEVWEPFAAKRGVKPVENVHPVYLMEAVIMKYGRNQGLI